MYDKEELEKRLTRNPVSTGDQFKIGSGGHITLEDNASESRYLKLSFHPDCTIWNKQELDDAAAILLLLKKMPGMF